LTKILLAEHDPELLAAYASELERNHFGIITATDGKGAIEKFVEHLPEIVVIDLDLTDSKGLDVLKAVLTTNPRTKVVVLTGRGQDLEQAERLGLELFLLKPTSPQTLVESVIAIVDLKSRPQLVIVTR
jgi:DNA-binding response OmpR family regulator